MAEVSPIFRFNEVKEKTVMLKVLPHLFNFKEHLRKSLKTILTYAQQDSELSDSFNSFPEQVNLHFDCAQILVYQMLFKLHVVSVN